MLQKYKSIVSGFYEKPYFSLARLLFSLSVCSVGNFTLPSLLNLMCPCNSEERWKVTIIWIFNIPAVILSVVLPRLSLLGSIPSGDESLVYWSLGFILNFPFYTMVIYIVISIGYLTKRPKPKKWTMKQLADEGKRCTEKNSI